MFHVKQCRQNKVYGHRHQFNNNISQECDYPLVCMIMCGRLMRIKKKLNVNTSITKTLHG